MKKPVFFDHIEVHVRDIAKYCAFLQKMFQGGRFKIINDSGISMFKSDDGLCIEIKERPEAQAPVNAGFCLPCLRMEAAEEFVTETLGLKIDKITDNPDGKVVFFTDHEGIAWHLKDYLKRDDYINW